MRLVTSIIVLALASAVAALEPPEVEFTERASYFTELDEVQSDTKLLVAYPWISVARGLSFSVAGQFRYDSANTTELSVDEFYREKKESMIGIEEFAFTLNVDERWPSTKKFGRTSFTAGKFVFPLFGVGDIVRPMDVVTAQNFTHNPVVRDPLDPTSDERLPQYGILGKWNRRFNDRRFKVSLTGAWLPVAGRNRYAEYGPWNIAPSGIQLKHVLPDEDNVLAGQQVTAHLCLQSPIGEVCGLYYRGGDKTPFVVPTSEISVDLVYLRRTVYGGSLVLPVPFLDGWMFRTEAAYSDYRHIRQDSTTVIGALEHIGVVRNRTFFLLAQGVWRVRGVNTLLEPLTRGALFRLRYGSLDESRWAVQCEGGVNVDPEGIVLQPSLFLPLSFLDGTWDKLGIETPVLETRFVWFGGKRENLFGGLYRKRRNIQVGLVFRY